jgi:hypothetical protein
VVSAEVSVSGVQREQFLTNAGLSVSLRRAALLTHVRIARNALSALTRRGAEHVEKFQAPLLQVGLPEWKTAQAVS